MSEHIYNYQGDGHVSGSARLVNKGLWPKSERYVLLSPYWQTSAGSFAATSCLGNKAMVFSQMSAQCEHIISKDPQILNLLLPCLSLAYLFRMKSLFEQRAK